MISHPPSFYLESRGTPSICCRLALTHTLMDQTGTPHHQWEGLILKGVEVDQVRTYVCTPINEAHAYIYGLYKSSNEGHYVLVDIGGVAVFCVYLRMYVYCVLFILSI